VAFIPRASTAGKGAMAGVGHGGPARAAPLPRVTVGKKGCRERKRDKVADGWGPHVSGCGGLAGRLVMVG
jgi:hypothetical protein